MFCLLRVSDSRSRVPATPFGAELLAAPRYVAELVAVGLGESPPFHEERLHAHKHHREGYKGYGGEYCGGHRGSFKIRRKFKKVGAIFRSFSILFCNLAASERHF